MQVIKSYLLTYNKKEENEVQDILVDAGIKGVIYNRDWKDFDSSLDQILLDLKNVYELNFDSDSMYAGSKLIWKELTFLNTKHVENTVKDLKLYTGYGLKSPLWFAHFLLSFLGDRILDKGKNYAVFRQDSSIQIIMYNYSDDWDENWYYKKYPDSDIYTKTISLEVKNLKPSNKVIRYKLDEANCSVYYKWVKMGKPKYFSEGEIMLLDRIIFPEVNFSLVEETADFTVSLPPFSIELIIIK